MTDTINVTIRLDLRFTTLFTVKKIKNGSHILLLKQAKLQLTI